MNAFLEVAVKNFLPQATVLKSREIGGGCINNATRIDTDQGTFFLKWNSHMPVDFFEKEKNGLSVLSSQSSFKIPEVLGVGDIDGRSFIIMDYIDSQPRSQNFWADFANRLAQMHRQSAPAYGLEVDNYIGKLHQSNMQRSHWANFFIENRILPQAKLAQDQRLISPEWSAKLESALPKMTEELPDEKPALLHGDLWSGNFMTDDQGYATVIDPAVYFGHREMELSFTRMFGGFDPIFYQTYQESFPMAPGFEQRIDIYNLYPSFVHLNLFGPSYLSGILQTIKHFQ